MLECRGQAARLLRFSDLCVSFRESMCENKVASVTSSSPHWKRLSCEKKAWNDLQFVSLIGAVQMHRTVREREDTGRDSESLVEDAFGVSNFL